MIPRERSRSAQVQDIGAYEAVFALFLASLFIVGLYDQRHFSARPLAWVLAILVLNLGYFVSSKSRPLSRSALSGCLLLNTIGIFGVLKATGGHSSVFWVGFLLPVLTASVTEDGVGPWPIVGASALLLALLYAPVHPRWYAELEWSSKISTLIFAAAVTRRGYAREAVLRRSIEEKRLQLEYLATRMMEEHAPIQTGGDFRDQLERRLRLLENPLAVLEDSVRLAELTAPDARADLKRIEACHSLLKSLTQDLFDILYHDEYWPEAASFEDIYRKVVADLRYPLAVKEIRFAEVLSPDLPRLPLSRPHIEQLLHGILDRAVLECGHGQTLQVEARMAGVSRDPYLEVSFLHPGLGDAGSLPHLQRIARRHGGWLQFEYKTQSVQYTLALPIHNGTVLSPPA